LADIAKTTKILELQNIDLIVDFSNSGGEDSCGSTGQGRPRRRQSAEEAPRHAR
jgi:hypothetical protein